jgi:hypothetical protein
MNQQLLVSIAPYLGYVIIVLLVYVYHVIYQRLPAQQRAALAQLILPIVQLIKETYAQATPEQRIAAATAFINTSFALMGLPAPNAAVVSAFVDFIFEQYGIKQPSSVKKIQRDNSLKG